MSTTLPNSGLIVHDYGESWSADDQANWTRLNNVLLKFQGLLNVSDEVIPQDRAVMIFNGTTLKFEPTQIDEEDWKETTTTTSTTTTTTTSTTSTTTTTT